MLPTLLPRYAGFFRSRFFQTAAFLTLALLTPLAEAEEYEAGQSYFGRNNYIEYRAGNLPLILTAPHGGDLRPAEIPDRTWGVTGTDRNTRELTEAMAAQIFVRTGKYPHVIISHLHRSKLDPNREIVEAAQGSPFAEQAWEEFHGYIRTARELADAEFGFGFLCDIHGHGHEIQRLELGYGLGNAQLNLSNAQLEAPGFGWNSSLRTLMLRRPGVPFPELLRGPRSLGDLFNDRGVPSWPSSQYPSPDGAPFFNGGYITRQHTCFVDNGPINGVQIEAYFTGVRDTDMNRRLFAASFAQVMQPYLWDNYGFSLGTLSLYSLQTETTEAVKGGDPVTLEILRDGYISFASTLNLELGGTATHGDDFLISNTSINFASGQSSATVTLFPGQPNNEAGDKTIEVRLAPNIRQAADLTPVVVTLGDGLNQTVRISAETPSVLESDEEAVFRLSRTSNAGSLTVHLEWDGSAVPGLDYDFPWDLPQEVTFPAGVSETLITVNLVDDAIPEPDKEIVLRVLPGDGYIPGDPDGASIRLIDDDWPSGIAVWLRGEVDGNRLLDSSGHGRPATTLPAGRGPVAVETPEGPAISFDGAEATAALPKFGLDTGEGFSIAFHFRIDPAAPTSEHNLLSFGPRNAPGSINIYLPNSSTLRTWMGSASSSALDVSRNWTDGTWRHYVLTVDPSGIMRVFVDGTIGRAAPGWVAPLAPDELFWIGWRRDTGNASDFFGGQIRDFRMYDRVLETSEIAALATGRLNFAAWLRKHDLPTTTSPLADLDGDGKELLLEYALGADPRAPGRAPRFHTRLVDNRLVLDFARQVSAGDLTWRVEAANELKPAWETIAEWRPDVGSWTLAPGASLQEDHGFVSVYDHENGSQQPARFMRLRVEKTTP